MLIIKRKDCYSSKIDVFYLHGDADHFIFVEVDMRVRTHIEQTPFPI